MYDCCRRFPNYPGYDWHMYTSFGSSFFPQGKRQCNSISPYFANNLVRYIGQYDCCHNVYAAILNTTLVKNAIGTLESSFSPHEGKAMPYKFLRRSHPGSISPFFVYAANFGSRFAGRTDIFFGIKKKVHWCVWLMSQRIRRSVPNYPVYDWHRYSWIVFFPTVLRVEKRRYSGMYDCCRNVYARVINTILSKIDIDTLGFVFSPQSYKFFRRSYPDSISSLFLQKDRTLHWHVWLMSQLLWQGLA